MLKKWSEKQRNRRALTQSGSEKTKAQLTKDFSAAWPDAGGAPCAVVAAVAADASDIDGMQRRRNKNAGGQDVNVGM